MPFELQTKVTRDISPDNSQVASVHEEVISSLFLDLSCAAQSERVIRNLWELQIIYKLEVYQLKLLSSV